MEERELINMKTVADMQARGLEIIPEGSMEGFPAFTNDYSARWNEWLRLYGVEPVCLASHNTINPRGRQSLSDEENIQALKDLIVYAGRMGFKMIRTNDTAPQVIEAAIPFAEQNDIYLGFEIHPPIRLDSEIISRNLAVVEKTGTKHFGFIPDTGIFAIKTPQVM